MRINKFLAQAGYGSRRKCEEYVLGGLVKINGKVITDLSTQVKESDKVEINQERLKAKQDFSYYKFYKPKGYVCSTNPDGGPSIFDLLPLKVGLTYIGRLDKESEGLLLISDDGRLTYKLTHPKFKKEKVYLVRTDKSITDGEISRMQSGMLIDGVMTQRAKVKRLNQRSFEITLTEGRNRQIRKMCRKLGLRVHKLKRIEVANIQIDDLEPGQYIELNKAEMNLIKQILEK